MTRRLQQLGTDAVVFTPGYYLDGDGRVFQPREAAALIAGASHAPVYGPYSTFMGTGVVGGYMPSRLEMGRQAARAVNGLLDGVRPATLGLPREDAGAYAGRLAPGAQVGHRRRTTFRRTPSSTSGRRRSGNGIASQALSSGVLLLQAVLIAALLSNGGCASATATALEESENA